MPNMIEVRVTRKRTEAERIASFELVRTDGEPLPPFSAGSHIDVEVESGLVRQYSLCNAPSERHRYLIGVLHEENGRGGSSAMHALVEGDMLRISEPRNLFALDPQASHSLLFAGGIGVTPLLAMTEDLADRGAPFTLHYCARSEARLAFKDRIADPKIGPNVAIHLLDGPEEQQLRCDEILASALPGTHLYVCGPTGFMEHVLERAKAQGWDDSRLHREFFAAAPVDHANDGSFELVLKSGRVISVAADQSAAQALEAAGVSVPLSCEQGVCGTCLTKVLDGEPDHRDMFLTDEEHRANDCFTPCCSRAKSQRLVLDLE